MNAVPDPCGATYDLGEDYPPHVCHRPAQHRGNHEVPAPMDGVPPFAWRRETTTRRGTSNSDKRGSSYDRRARRQRLVVRFRADVDLLVVRHTVDYTMAYPHDPSAALPPLGAHLEHELVAAARCWCCGRLLHAGVTWSDGTRLEGTLTCDRILPGIEGGTYADANLRPACALHNSSTGGKLGAERKAAKATS